jgi:hypothetical protein
LPSGAEDISTICAECTREEDHSGSFLMQARTIVDQALETDGKAKSKDKEKTLNLTAVKAILR